MSVLLGHSDRWADAAQLLMPDLPQKLLELEELEIEVCAVLCCACCAGLYADRDAFLFRCCAAQREVAKSAETLLEGLSIPLEGETVSYAASVQDIYKWLRHCLEQE